MRGNILWNCTSLVVMFVMWAGIAQAV